ncbi:MAG TPA: hypothetical protein VEY50_08565 [Lysobacter sp.]|nr:hypothetical protein [Lysobacter sp.]
MDLSSSWINGRTLALALQDTGTRNRFGAFAPTSRVPLDLARDRDVLGIEREHGVPFVADGNLLVTIHDFDLSESPWNFIAHTDVITLANLRFTRRALQSAVAGFIADTAKNETLRIERLAAGLDLGNPRAVSEFSSAVCVWGKGHRVWGNLMRLHSPKSLGRAVAQWLMAAREATEPAKAIAPGLGIKGLGVSFASKHLRLFAPDRFATLDEVISRGLGYALNGAGYNLWLHDLKQIRQRDMASLRVGDIESGIFVLARQVVRGIPSSRRMI